ncbi:MAG: tetratricopeptide repeat protein, partial [Planctomycetota bacterium]
LNLSEYLEKAGDVKGAVKWLEKAVATRRRPREVAARLARAYRRLGNREKALEAYREARARNPRDGILAYEYGTLLEEAGALEESEALLAAAARLAGGLPFISHYLAYVWARRGVKLEDAEKAARDAVEAEPGVGAYRAVLGFILLRKGDRAGAQEEFVRALALDPDPFVHRLYGDVLFASDRKRDAAAHWRKAVALEPRWKTLLGSRIRDAGR